MGGVLPVVRTTTSHSSSSVGLGTSTFKRKRSSCASGRGYVPSISMGFSVARTKKGSSRRCRVPAMVTACSAMASRSADWVLGVARLISSASTTWAKMGPRCNVKGPRPPRPASSVTKICAPVTSLGMRSGVN